MKKRWVVKKDDDNNNSGNINEKNEIELSNEDANNLLEAIERIGQVIKNQERTEYLGEIDNNG